MFGWFSKFGRGSGPGSPQLEEDSGSRTRKLDASPSIPHLFEQALAEHRAGRLANAENACRRVLAEIPDHVDALHFLGVLAYQLGRYAESVEWITQALSHHDGNVPAHANLGKAYLAQGELERAISCYQRAIELAPDYFEAHLLLGRARALCGDSVQALDCIRAALAHAPADATAQHALGDAFHDLGDAEQAVVCFHSAIAQRPEFAEAHCDLGTSLKALNRLNESEQSYREALRHRPDYPIAYLNLGIVLRDRRLPEEAIACFQKAIEIQPDSADAHYCLGHTYSDGDRLAEARQSFQAALSLRADFPEARWSLAMSQLPSVYAPGDDPIKAREAFAAHLDALDEWFAANPDVPGHTAVGAQQPFALAYLDQNNRDLLQRYGRLCARLMGQWFARQSIPCNAAAGRDSGLIRVGIVSQYFRNHSVWNALVRGWFDQLDRKRFALFAFCLGVDEDSETLFAKSRAAQFMRGPKELPQWVEAIARQRPEVLIFPEIGMDPLTLRLASMRLAPVQIATWGHPETTGLPTIDYYLSASGLEPENAQTHYTERLIKLPALGCYVERAQVEPEVPELGGWGIGMTVPLLICAGTPFKYAPQHDWIFPQIAGRLGRCRFVFFRHWTPGLTERLEQRLRRAFDIAGVEFDEHVTFIPWQSKSAFYGLMQRADIILDTIGFSGFNTALQAVECGLPIVTVEGRFLRGRLASGILRHIGLHELVANSVDDYVAIASKLIEDTGFNTAVRSRLLSQRNSLYRDATPIRALEDLLTKLTRSGEREDPMSRTRG